MPDSQYMQVDYFPDCSFHLDICKYNLIQILREFDCGLIAVALPVAETHSFEYL